MDKIFWKREKAEILTNELMAFTIAKLAPYEWVRITMFIEENIYNSPPIFCWRFSSEVGGLQDLYINLEKCITSFEGHINWTMYKGNGLNGQSRRNYTIEPTFMCEIGQLHGWGSERGEILKKDYKELIVKAVEDVKPLCAHIENIFNVSNSRPFPPILP